jgi:hypothetical protein
MSGVGRVGLPCPARRAEGVGLEGEDWQIPTPATASNGKKRKWLQDPVVAGRASPVIGAVGGIGEGVQGRTERARVSRVRKEEVRLRKERALAARNGELGWWDWMKRSL